MANVRTVKGVWKIEGLVPNVGHGVLRYLVKVACSRVHVVQVACDQLLVSHLRLVHYSKMDILVDRLHQRAVLKLAARLMSIISSVLFGLRSYGCFSDGLDVQVAVFLAKRVPNRGFLV